jgi:hypothetical protein
MYDQNLGRAAYQAYAKAGGWKTYDGRDMPTWYELSGTETGQKTQHRWTRAAEAVYAELHRPPEQAVMDESGPLRTYQLPFDPPTPEEMENRAGWRVEMTFEEAMQLVLEECGDDVYDLIIFKVADLEGELDDARDELVWVNSERDALQDELDQLDA